MWTTAKKQQITKKWKQPEANRKGNHKKQQQQQTSSNPNNNSLFQSQKNPKAPFEIMIK